VKILAGALVCTVVGALIGAGLGWLGNPKPVAVPDESLQFVNFVGPILGGSIGATLGFILGGGWVAKVIADRQDTRIDS
jgi:hypothetical protein